MVRVRTRKVSVRMSEGTWRTSRLTGVVNGVAQASENATSQVAPIASTAAGRGRCRVARTNATP